MIVIHLPTNYIEPRRGNFRIHLQPIGVPDKTPQLCSRLGIHIVGFHEIDARRAILSRMVETHWYPWTGEENIMMGCHRDSNLFLAKDLLCVCTVDPPKPKTGKMCRCPRWTSSKMEYITFCNITIHYTSNAMSIESIDTWFQRFRHQRPSFPPSSSFSERP